MLESFVREAFKQKDSEIVGKSIRGNNTYIEDNDDKSIEEAFRKPRIVVVGCGGAGNNTINRLYNMGVKGADVIAVNTDGVHLNAVKADRKVLIGQRLTRGLGAGGFPDIGAKAAELSREVFEEMFADADLVFLTAGMGGGTGTGAAPVVADVAKKMGAIVVGMVSTPFIVERARRNAAKKGIEDLRQVADTVIVLDNNKLLDYVPNLPLDQSFAVMDHLIADTIKGLTETITQPSLINLDFADVKTIMNCGGLAVMLVNEIERQKRSTGSIKQIIGHPLLDVDYSGAKGCLLHLTGGRDMTLREAEELADLVTYSIDPNANVIWGARIRDDFEGKVRILAIMTGVSSSQVVGPDGNGRRYSSDQFRNLDDQYTDLNRGKPSIKRADSDFIEWLH